MNLATIKRKKHYMSLTSNGGGCFLKLSIIRIEPYNQGKLNNASLFNLQATPFQSFTPTDFRLRRALRLQQDKTTAPSKPSSFDAQSEITEAEEFDQSHTCLRRQLPTQFLATSSLSSSFGGPAHS